MIAFPSLLLVCYYSELELASESTEVLVKTPISGPYPQCFCRWREAGPGEIYLSLFPSGAGAVWPGVRHFDNHFFKMSYMLLNGPVYHTD
jgi:hypothetical protein